MKTQHIIVLLGIALAIGIGLWISSRKKPHPLVGFTALVPAVEAYARDLAARSQPLPDSVTLRQLIDGKYIASEAVSALADLETPLSLVRVESDPAKVQLRVRLRNGSLIMQFADVSKQ